MALHGLAKETAVVRVMDISVPTFLFIIILLGRVKVLTGVNDSLIICDAAILTIWLRRYDEQANYRNKINHHTGDAAL